MHRQDLAASYMSYMATDCVPGIYVTPPLTRSFKVHQASMGSETPQTRIKKEGLVQILPPDRLPRLV
jgi:hypothetical protein